MTRYCSKCGEKLAVTKRKRGYDKRNGQPTYTWNVWCPNPNKGFFAFGHTRASKQWESDPFEEY